MTNHRRSEGALATVIAMVAVLGAAAMAFAASAEASAGTGYPQAQGERFHNGAHGWSASTNRAGTCAQNVTCPTISNTAPTSGGIGGGGDGYIETAENGLVAPGVLATSSGTWQSPAFKYNGNDGAEPAALTLSLARRANVDALLSAGGSVQYSVAFVDMSRGPNVVAVDGRDVTHSTTFAELPSVSVDPDRLHVGDRYAIKITTRYLTPADALPKASVDYDNVLLKASGTGGPGGGGSSAVPARAHAATTTTVVMIGRRLYLRTRCARTAHSKSCKRRFTAVNRRHGTRRSTTAHSRVRRGRSHLVSVRLKRSFAHKLRHRRHVLIRQRVTKHGHRANTRYVRYRIKHS